MHQVPKPRCYDVAKLQAFQKAGNFGRMSTHPRISVILPTYNRCDSLLQAIDSVARQSFQDYEIIIADDGSTDETAERLARRPGAEGRVAREQLLDGLESSAAQPKLAESIETGEKHALERAR